MREILDAPASAASRRLLSPFQVHYSQTHIRPLFQNGESVIDAASLVTSELYEPVPAESDEPAVADDLLGAPTSGDNWWLLQHPFPEIEVIQWRCKLRREDGTIKVDESGMDLYGDLEWYTLDNRRLYCLQRAAVKFHPKEVRVVVCVVRQEDANVTREFRKFRTLDCGRTVGIGHRDDAEMPRFSWRKELGLPDEELPAGKAMVRNPRRNNDRRWGGRGAGDRNGSHGGAPEREGRDLVTNLALFILVYAVLRLTFHTGRRMLAAPAPMTPDSDPPFGVVDER